MEAWRPIAEWVQQVENWLHHENKRDDRPAADTERPNSDLVLEGLRAGAIPGIDASSVRLVRGGTAVEFEMPKPDGGTTTREMDVEAAALFALLLFSGGWLFLKISGDLTHVYFYGRLSIYDSGETDRPYVSRIIANTAPGTHTREGAKWHSWCRSEWSYKPPREGDTGGKHGLEGAVAQAKAAFARVFRLTHDRLTEGLTEQRFAELLDVTHRMMSRRPLKGQS